VTGIYGRSASCRVADPADYTRVPQGLLEEDFDLAYYCVVVKSVIAVENVAAAINQIAQTTLRKGVGQHCLDETVSEADRIHVDIQGILDVQTTDWGEVVTLVDLKNVQLPESMKREMARQAEAEREGHAEIIATEGDEPRTGLYVGLTRGGRMKAVVVRQWSGSESLTVETVPDPVADERDVVVELRASALRCRRRSAGPPR